jgi:hypothetical protein
MLKKQENENGTKAVKIRAEGKCKYRHKIKKKKSQLSFLVVDIFSCFAPFPLFFIRRFAQVQLFPLGSTARRFKRM